MNIVSIILNHKHIEFIIQNQNIQTKRFNNNKIKIVNIHIVNVIQILIIQYIEYIVMIILMVQIYIVVVLAY